MNFIIVILLWGINFINKIPRKTNLNNNRCITNFHTNLNLTGTNLKSTKYAIFQTPNTAIYSIFTNY